MKANGATFVFKPGRVDWLAFGLFVQARRKHAGIRPGRLARETGLTVDHIKRAEAQKNPGETAYLALCKWMGEPPELFAEAGK